MLRKGKAQKVLVPWILGTTGQPIELRVCSLKKIFFKHLFIFLRDRVWVGEGQREGNTESEAGSSLRAVSTEPDTGLKFTDREIMT